ncbi:MAG: hypothetical protein IPM39_02845 [Chloroflexi bacterium]|nr:hypothetical protein [Chloroflexota bacterium]
MPERRRALPWLVLGLLAALSLGVALVSAGLFDPALNGTAVRQRPLTPSILLPENQSLGWLDEPLLAANYTLWLTAVHQSGEPDVGYGLIVGDEQAALTVLVSPLGYVTVRLGETAVLPWQPWPHVHAGAEPNEIWLNVGGVEGSGRAAVRINRELLWAGEVGELVGQVGLVGENYGRETAVVAFPQLTIRE